MAPVLVEQHLLLVSEGISFKILVVCHEALNGFGTECVSYWYIPCSMCFLLHLVVAVVFSICICCMYHSVLPR